MTLAHGKVVCTLEGGYVRSVLAKCVQSVVSNLLDRSSPEVSDEEAKQDEKDHEGTNILNTIDAMAATNIRSTIAAHKPYWACLRELT
jgi:acetoin utilization deacetylase AcuC-like enzyme